MGSFGSGRRAHWESFKLRQSPARPERASKRAPAFDLVNTTAYIPEDVLALDLCGQKSFFSARQGLLDFAKVCQVADPRDRVQRLILTAEMVIRREAEVAQSIPHVVAAIQHCADMLKDVFFD